jgi:hypothetical protein
MERGKIEWQTNCPHIPYRGKLVLSLLTIFLTALGMIVAWGLERRGCEISEAKDSVLLLVESLAAQQEQIVIGTEQMLSTLAQLPQVQQRDAQACNRLFRELKDRHPSYATIAAVTPDGEVFSRFEPVNVNIGDLKHVRDALESRSFSSGEYIVGRVSGVPTIHYSHPVFDSGGQLSSVVVAGFKLDEYARFIEKMKLPEGSAVVIADHKGVRLYREPESAAASIGQLNSCASRMDSRHTSIL